MIKLTKKVESAIPEILQTTGSIATQLLLEQAANGDYNFDFKSSIYGHEEVKSDLKKIQHHKCCFCESKINHIDYGDVEHFRPKAGWVQDSEKLNQPGYYWLVYDWDNLLLSCKLCNELHKKNHFPLSDNDNRAIATRNITVEQPLFIHPANDNPEDFIYFKEEIPVAIKANVRGVETIKKLGLDRELLNEQRRARLNMIRDIYDLARSYPDTPEKPAAKRKIEKYKTQSQHDETEYACMLRSFFKEHPIDF